MADKSYAQELLEYDIPSRYRAPGCAAAIVKDGELLAQHAWGYANLETRAPVTTSTVFPICSISKQMVCLVLTELIEERGEEFVDKIHEALRGILPKEVTSDKELTIERLVGMQSGLRDYWALTALWGAAPQDRFSLYVDAPEAMKRVGGYHFAPGTEMSYCNSNYVAISSAIERATGQTLSDLLTTRLFEPAGMKTASLRADTSRIPAPLVGYEGSETAGYIPYANRIEWAGDAGIMASLEDMIAYEKYVQKGAKDEKSAYYKNSQDPTYIDGNAAHYGQGLMNGKIADLKWVGHSGGLAGFRLRRTFIPSANVSLITLFNSETDSKAVMEYTMPKLVSKASGEQQRESAAEKDNAEGNATTRNPTSYISWAGVYFDDDSRVAVVVRQDNPHKIKVNYDGHYESLRITSGNEASSKYMTVAFNESKRELAIRRLMEHRSFTARLLDQEKILSNKIKAADYLGEYYSAEIDSTLHVTGSGTMLYGSFDGYLGQGPIHTMRHLAEDVWWLSCFRSLDAPSPGYWSVVFNKEGGKVTGVTVGCWLARKIEYVKKA